MYEYSAKLIKIVDGDTIDVEIDLGFSVHIKERVRLAGIDAPESRTRNKNEKTWGLAAKYRLQTLIEDLDTFIIRTEIQKKGKFGRILGSIIIPADTINQLGTKYSSGVIDVNKLLVEEQLAIPYSGLNKNDARKKYGVDELWNTPYSK